jgi:hypothetical protein
VEEDLSILRRIHGSARTHLISAEDLRILCAELSANGAYQILAAHRGDEHTDRIEIKVSVPKKA